MRVERGGALEPRAGGVVVAPIEVGDGGGVGRVGGELARLEQPRRALDDEMSGALRELLAAEGIPPSTAQQWRQAALDQQLSFLPVDKREKTEALLLQYTDIDEQIRALASGDRTPESTAERRHVLEAYDVKRAALQALLSAGKTSRFYKKLVEGEEVAGDVSTGNSSGRYPGWFYIQVELLIQAIRRDRRQYAMEYVD